MQTPIQEIIHWIEVRSAEESNVVNQDIPEWWWQYKKANPHNKDEYDKREHCCSRFWKDFCNCVR